MTLAFFKVDNSKGYSRDEFWELYDKPDSVLEKLSMLNHDEVRIYDMCDKFSADIFQEDYNNEILDYDWWCVVINK